MNAKWSGDGHYYPGRIGLVNDTLGYDLVYDDGKEEKAVDKLFMRVLDVPGRTGYPFPIKRSAAPPKDKHGRSQDWDSTLGKWYTPPPQVQVSLPSPACPPAAPTEKVLTCWEDPRGFTAYQGLNGLVIIPCGICHGYPKEGEVVLVCEGCEMDFHLKCTGMSEIPEGDWFCDECIEAREGFDEHLFSLDNFLIHSSGSAPLAPQAQALAPAPPAAKEGSKKQLGTVHNNIQIQSSGVPKMDGVTTHNAFTSMEL